MPKRSVILLLFVSFSIAFFTVRTHSETGDSNRTEKSTNNESSHNLTEREKSEEIEKLLESLRNMTPEQRIKVLKHYREKERAETREQVELHLEQMYEESARKGFGPLISRKQKHENFLEIANERSKELLYEKAALGATEEQWKLIKPKLEKVRQLRNQANSVVGLSLAGGSSENEKSIRTRARPKPPTWQWRQPWKRMASSKLTEAQKLTKRLIALVENNNTTPEQFIKTMDALRKARKEEEQIKKKLDEARKELREGLTLRQEAALVLMKWL